MNITSFFLVIFAGLIAIFFAFKPLNIDAKTTKEIPQFELKNFVLYELDTKSLQTLMVGKNSKKYKDRYVVKDIDYTDNGKDFVANIKARNGLYKGDIINLNDDVKYTREDGLNFTTQHVVYNKKTKIAIADKNYTLIQDKNIIKGTYLKYDNFHKNMMSKNIDVVYTIKKD